MGTRSLADMRAAAQREKRATQSSGQKVIDMQLVMRYLHMESLYKETHMIKKDALLAFGTPNKMVVSNRHEGWSCRLTDAVYAVLETEQGYYIPLAVDKLAFMVCFRDNSPITLEGLKSRGVEVHNTTNGQVFTSKERIKVRVNNLTRYAALHVPKKIMLQLGGKYGCPVILNNDKIASHGGGRGTAGDYVVCNLLNNGCPDFNTATVVNGAIFEADYDMSRFSKQFLQDSDAKFLAAVSRGVRYDY